MCSNDRSVMMAEFGDAEMGETYTHIQPLLLTIILPYPTLYMPKPQSFFLLSMTDSFLCFLVKMYLNDMCYLTIYFCVMEKGTENVIMCKSHCHNVYQHLIDNA